jgi:hypothetical protein
LNAPFATSANETVVPSPTDVEVGAPGHAVLGGTMWYPFERETTSANGLEKGGEMRLAHSDYRIIFQSGQKDFPNWIKVSVGDFLADSFASRRARADGSETNSPAISCDWTQRGCWFAASCLASLNSATDTPRIGQGASHDDAYGRFDAGREATHAIGASRRGRAEWT